MKKTKLFLAITAFAGLLISCRHSIIELNSQETNKGNQTVASESEDKVCISFVLKNGTNGERTAVPSIGLEDYFYTLRSKSAASENDIDSATEVTHITHFSIFDGSNPLSLNRGYYIFTLTGYKTKDESDNTPIIEGVSGVIDLTSKGKTISFKMYAAKGSKGNAKITLQFPESVAKVSAWHSTDFLGKEAVNQGKDYTSFEDGTSNLKKIEYSLTDLSSGEKHYAQFRLYDSEDTLIASRSESIIVVGDKESASTLTITMDALHTYNVSLSLKQNGNEWLYSKQEIILKDKTTGKEYVITDKDGDGVYDGTFTGAAAEGIFEIYIRDEDSETETDLGLEFNTSEQEKTINFVTVITPATGGVQFTPDSPLSGGLQGTEENQYLIPEGGTGIEFTVEQKPGYSAEEGKITINGSIPEDANPNKDGTQITLDSSSAGTEITTAGTSLIEYTISYNLDGGSWTSGYIAPSKYTVENYTTVILPKYGNLTQNGKDFDGWKNTDGTKFAALKEGQAENLTLTALWKSGVNIEGNTSDTITPEEREEFPDIKGKIFACGYSLIIKWYNDNPSTRKTVVYYDYNSDGVVNGDDKLVDANQDFTDFKLMAGSKNGDQPASDFKFTVLGGKLAGLEGLGKDKLNTSTVNISGNSTQIGNDNTGIILESLTNECVNVTGQMSGDYSITLVSSHKYEANHSYYKVAFITDPSYAQLGKFKCIYKEDNDNLLLSIMDQGTSKVIYLANPNPIALPPSLGTPGENVDGGVLWLEDDTSDTGFSKKDFMLGDTTTISIPCSVFSIAVSNGTFSLTSTEMKDDKGDTLATDNLGQTSNGYSTELSDGTDYIYLHMFSKSNQITAARATEFLKKVIFKKASETEEIKISINLETVPYELITAVDPTLTNFKYYDGSFYLNVQKTVSWDTAYANAKSTIFNGMNGYLMTITSQVENDYIFKQLNGMKAWTGGSRAQPHDESQPLKAKFDEMIFTGTKTQKTWKFLLKDYKENCYNTYSDFYWQCGPEAGKKINDLYANWQDNEPNAGGTSFNGSEYCVQFYTNGQWNDMPNGGVGLGIGTGDYTPQSYIVEFRPYKTQYGEQKANYQSVSLDASY